MIYAINKRTKEHRIASERSFLASEWRRVEADPDGWIKHDGGECPLPDGVKCQWRSSDGFESEVIKGNLVSWIDGTRHITHYRPILDAQDEPEAPEWDSEGLPPVGVDCNCWHTGTHQGVVTVRYMGSEMCVLLNHDHGEEQCGPISAYRFEPLRTPAQRAEDEAVEAMKSVTGDGFGCFEVSEATARALYRAGYRKVEDEK